jgi:hypothetical protein
MAVLPQEVGGRRSDHTGPEDDDPHRASPPGGSPLTPEGRLEPLSSVWSAEC